MPIVRTREAAVVATCKVCGTGYTERGWSWLDVLGEQRIEGDEALDLRRCGVPRCRNTLARPVLLCAGDAA